MRLDLHGNSCVHGTRLLHDEVKGVVALLLLFHCIHSSSFIACAAFVCKGIHDRIGVKMHIAHLTLHRTLSIGGMEYFRVYA